MAASNNTNFMSRLGLFLGRAKASQNNSASTRKRTSLLGGSLGFTLVELLTATAIIAVLGGIAFVGVSNFTRSMDQKKADSFAQEILVAAQNRLTNLYANGKMKELSADESKRVYALGANEKPSDWNNDLTYYGLCYITPQSDSSARDLLMPEDLISEDLYNGNWVIEYDLKRASVYAVYFCEDTSISYSSGTPSFYADNAQGLRREGSTASRTGRNDYNPIVGYYGGGGELTEIPDRDETEMGLSLEVNNAEELTVTAKAEVPAAYIGSSFAVKFTVTMTSESGGQTTLVAADGQPYRTIDIDGTATETYVLDKLYGYDPYESRDLSFESQFCKNLEDNFTPGEDVTISATAIITDVVGAPAGEAKPVTTSSLFADYDESNGIAYISSGRHLQNLATQVSGLSDGKVKAAVQTGVINFESDEWLESYPRWSAFTPIVNNSLKSYDGGSLPIDYLHVFSCDTDVLNKGTAEGAAGLFAAVPDGMEFKNMNLTAPVISPKGASKYYAGVLAGYAKGSVSVSSVYMENGSVNTDMNSYAGGLVGYCAGDSAFTSCTSVLNITALKDDGGRLGITWQTSFVVGDYAGGLLGYGNGNATVSYCAAATNLGAQSYGGGMLGRIAGVMTATNSYTDCCINGKSTSCRIGGMAGSVSENAGSKFDNCYTAGFQTGDAYLAAGFVGSKIGATEQETGSVSKRGVVQNCYTMFQFAGTSGNETIKKAISDVYAEIETEYKKIGFIEIPVGVYRYVSEKVVNTYCSNINSANTGEYKSGGGISGLSLGWDAENSYVKVKYIADLSTSLDFDTNSYFSLNLTKNETALDVKYHLFAQAKSEPSYPYPLTKDAEGNPMTHYGDYNPSVVDPTIPLNELYSMSLSTHRPVYTGAVIKPTITVEDEAGNVLKEGQDYYLEFNTTDFVNVGSIKVTAYGMGTYGGSLEDTYTIQPATLSSVSDIAPQQYTRNPIYIDSTAMEVYAGTIKLKAGEYDAKYTNNTNVGEATIEVSGKGNFTGTITKTFKIVDAITSISVVDQEVTYTGSALEPAIIVRGKAGAYDASDYTVTYANNIVVGTATVTVTGTGDKLTGSMSTTFKIVPKSIKGATITTHNATYFGGEYRNLDSVVLDGVTLKSGVDYSVEYRNNINAGTAYVDITGIGNYTGSETGTFTVWRRYISEASVVSIADQTFDGTAKTTTFELSYNKMTLVEGTDFVSPPSYSDNVKVGTAHVTVTGKGNYMSEKTLDFQILACDLSSATVTVSGEFVYNGEEQKPVPTVTLNDTTIASDLYEVSYENNINAGTATVTITGIEDKGTTGTASTTFEIAKRDISSAVVSVSGETYIYNTDAIEPGIDYVKAKLGDVDLIAGQDYTITDYDNNINASDSAKVIIAGTGSNFGEASGYFTIEARSIANESTDIDASVASQTFTGEELKPGLPDITVIYHKSSSSDVELKHDGTEYTVVGYDNNINPGSEAVVTIQGAGNYKDSRTINFTISAADLSKATITVNKEFTYKGKEIKPGSSVPENVTVALNGKTIDPKYYDLSWSDNIDVNSETNTPTVTATGKNGFSGSVSTVFIINPKDITGIGAVSVVDTNYTFGYENKEPGYDKLKVTVTLDSGETEMEAEKDYVITGYDNNFNASTKAKVFIEGTGNYTGVASGTFSIKARSIANAEYIEWNIKDQAYTGEQVIPSLEDITVIYHRNATSTREAKDFELAHDGSDYVIDTTACGENINPGTEAYVTIVGKGNYQNSKKISFTISSADLSKAEVAVSGDYVYNGSEQKPVPTVTLNGKTISSDWYEVSYENNVNAGTATVTVTGIAEKGCTGSASTTFEIAKRSIEGATVTVDKSYTYTSVQIQPKIGNVTVELADGTSLTATTDFTIEGYENNIVACDAKAEVNPPTVKVAGAGNYTGKASGTFTIARRSIALPSDPANEKFTFTVADQVYTGEAVVPSLDDITIIYQRSSKASVELAHDGTDYKVTKCSNNIEPGTEATVTIEGLGNYRKTRTVNFTIVADLTSADIKVNTPYTYDGTEKKPSYDDITVTLNGKTVDSKYFDITWSNNVDATEAAVISITGKNGFTGEASGNFTIAQKNIEDAKVTAESKSYSGTKRTPDPTVVLDGVTLVKGTDYTVEWSNNINASEKAVVTVTGTNNYTGTASGNFTITPWSFSKKIGASIPDQEYTGSQITPTADQITVQFQREQSAWLTLEIDKDYRIVSYGENINPGTDAGSVVIEGIGNYKDTMTVKFNIVKTLIDLSGATVQVDNQIYNHGNPLTPAPTVVLDDATVPADCYTVTYDNNVNVGTASATITGIESKGYTGSKTVNFTINPCSLSTATVTVSGNFVYNRSAQTPTPVVKIGDVTVPASAYTVGYANNTDAGQATVTVTAVEGEGYSDFASTTFTIAKKDLSDAKVTIPDEKRGWKHDAVEPVPTVVLDGVTLTKDTEYTVSYKDNDIATTKAQVTVSGANNYTGSKTITFTINPKSIQNDMTITIPDQAYTGSQIKLSAEDITIVYNRSSSRHYPLEPETDYTVTAWGENVGPGEKTGWVTVKGLGNYNQSIEKVYFNILVDINQVDVTVAEQTYTGSALTPDPTVKFNGKTLTKGTDYTVEWANNINASSNAEVTITGIGGYTGTKTVNWTINPKNLGDSDVSMTVADQEYKGTAATPTPTITYNGMSLVQGTDFTTSYENNTVPGTATATATGTGNYTGSASKSFVITAYRNIVLKYKASGKYVTLKTIKVQVGKPYTETSVSLNNPTKSGYTFCGWYNSGHTVKVLDIDKNFNFSALRTVKLIDNDNNWAWDTGEDVTLYAAWGSGYTSKTIYIPLTDLTRVPKQSSSGVTADSLFLIVNSKDVGANAKTLMAKSKSEIASATSTINSEVYFSNSNLTSSQRRVYLESIEGVTSVGSTSETASKQTLWSGLTYSSTTSGTATILSYAQNNKYLRYSGTGMNRTLSLGNSASWTVKISSDLSTSQIYISAQDKINGKKTYFTSTLRNLNGDFSLNTVQKQNSPSSDKVYIYYKMSVYAPKTYSYDG